MVTKCQQKPISMNFDSPEFQKSKLLYGDLGRDLLTVNLQAEFRKFYFGYVEVVVVEAPAN